MTTIFCAERTVPHRWTYVAELQSIAPVCRGVPAHVTAKFFFRNGDEEVHTVPREKAKPAGCSAFSGRFGSVCRTYFFEMVQRAYRVSVYSGLLNVKDRVSWMVREARTAGVPIWADIEVTSRPEFGSDFAWFRWVEYYERKPRTWSERRLDLRERRAAFQRRMEAHRAQIRRVASARRWMPFKRWALVQMALDTMEDRP